MESFKISPWTTLHCRSPQGSPVEWNQRSSSSTAMTCFALRARAAVKVDTRPYPRPDLLDYIGTFYNLI